MRREEYQKEKRDESYYKRKRWLIILSSLLALTLLFSVSYIFGQSKIAGEVSQIALAETKKAPAKKNGAKNPSYNYADVVPINADTIAQAWDQRGNYHAIGQVGSKDFGINLNIYQGVGNIELNLGAGTLKPNQTMGENNYALAGHNMHDHRYFSNLYWAVKKNNYENKEISVTDYKNIYTYRIYEARFINPDQFNLVQNSTKFSQNPVLSLFTCDWSGHKRVFMRGRFVSTVKYTDQTRKTYFN